MNNEPQCDFPHGYMDLENENRWLEIEPGKGFVKLRILGNRPLVFRLNLGDLEVFVGSLRRAKRECKGV